MKSKNNHTVSVILSAAKNLVNTQRMSSGSFTPFGMTKSTLHAVLCTLCSVLCFASCSEENLVDTPQTPNELCTLSVDINLPQGKPAFGGENTESARTVGPELVAEILLGDSIKARNSETPSTTTSSITTDDDWANGDELILHIAVSDAPITYTEGKLTLKYYEAASAPQPSGEGWYLDKARSYTKYGAEFVAYAEALPLLAADTSEAGEIKIDLTQPLTIRVDENAMGATAQVTYVYAPDMQLTTGAVLAQKDDATITAPEKFTYADGAWSALARVRVHTGAAGDVVTLTSSAFDTAWDVEPTTTTTTTDGIRIYTATTNSDGNAYFHGISNGNLDGSEGKDLKIKLTHMRVAVESPASPVSRTVELENPNTLLITLAEPLTLLEASSLVSFQLEENKPYKLLVNAKRTIAKQENLTYIAGDATKELVAAQIQAGLAETDAAIGRFVVTGTTIGDGLHKGIGNHAIKLEFADATVLPANALSGCSGLKEIIFRNKLTNVVTGALADVPTTCALVLAAGQGNVTAANNTLQWQGREWASIQEGGVNYKPLANYLCNTVGEGTGVYYEYTAEDGKKYAVIDGNTPAENVENLKNQIAAASSATGLAGFWVVNGLESYPDGGIASTVVGEAIRRYTGNKTISILQLPVTALPENAFSGCTKLAALPWEDITSIGANAFSGCTGLTGTITIKQEADVNANAFKDADVSDCTLVLAAGTTITNMEKFGATWGSIQVGDVEYKMIGDKLCTVTNGVPVFTENGINYAVLDGIAEYAVTSGIVNAAVALDPQITNFYVVNELNEYSGGNGTAGTVVGEALSKQTGISILVADATQLCENAFSGCKLTAVTFKKVVTGYESAFTGATVSACALVLAEGQSDADITAEGNTLKWAGASWASIQVGDVNYKALRGYACKVMGSGDNVYYEYTDPQDANNKKYAVIDGAESGVTNVQNQLKAAPSVDGVKNFLVVNELALYTTDSFTDAGTVVGEAIRQLPSMSPTSARNTGYAFNITLVHETDVPDEAFYGCLALNSVTLPSSDNTTITIGADAFENCSNLNSISLTNVTSIGAGAFQGCTSLTGELTLPNVTSIGAWAFYECIGLEGELTLPNVTSIGAYAFSNCTSLAGISSLGSVTWIENNTFNGCSGLEGDLSLPNVTSIDNCAFFNCTGLTSNLSLPKVESIGTSAFYGCAFTNVTFTQEVKNYEFAFNGATVSNCALELAAGQDGVTAYGQTLTWAGQSWASIKVGDYEYFKEDGYVILTIAGNDEIKYTVIDGSCGRKDLISPDTDVEPVKNQINNAPSYNGAKNLWVINNLSTWEIDDIYISVISTAIKLSECDINLVLADADIIPEYAFYNNSYLMSVDAHKVTSVGKYAFSLCTGLKNLTFRTVVNTVYNTFYNLETNNVTLKLNIEQVGVNGKKWKDHTWANIIILPQ